MCPRHLVELLSTDSEAMKDKIAKAQKFIAIMPDRFVDAFAHQIYIPNLSTLTYEYINLITQQLNQPKDDDKLMKEINVIFFVKQLLMTAFHEILDDKSRLHPIFITTFNISKHKSFDDNQLRKAFIRGFTHEILMSINFSNEHQALLSTLADLSPDKRGKWNDARHTIDKTIRSLRNDDQILNQLNQKFIELRTVLGVKATPDVFLVDPLFYHSLNLSDYLQNTYKKTVFNFINITHQFKRTRRVEIQKNLSNIGRELRNEKPDYDDMVSKISKLRELMAAHTPPLLTIAIDLIYKTIDDKLTILSTLASAHHVQTHESKSENIISISDQRQTPHY